METIRVKTCKCNSPQKSILDLFVFHSSSPEVGGFQRAVSDPQIEQSFAEAMQPYCYAMPRCDYTDPYRRTDGQCNNPINPLLGSSQTPQQRILPNAYDNCKFVTSTEKTVCYLYIFRFPKTNPNLGFEFLSS